jgi:parvulin-like peptidyl-prolyl isomerase
MVALLLALGLSACGGGGSEAIVAKVAGRPITKAQFTHWLSVQGGATASSSSPQDAGLKRQVMETLISAQWTLAEASKLGVSVSDKEAEQQLSVLDYAANTAQTSGQLFPREAELKKSLSARGLTHADRVWLMKLNLLGTKVEQKSRLLAEQAVTHAQIAKYYEAHRGQFVVGEEREFMILQNMRPVVVKAKREIEAGKSFLSVAKRVSIDQEAPEGVQRLKRGEEEPEFVAHIFAARPHVLVGPIKFGTYDYMFEITKITPTREQTLAQAEASIRRRLAGERLRRTSAELARARTKTWKGRTSCRPGYVVPLCVEYARAG